MYEPFLLYFNNFTTILLYLQLTHCYMSLNIGVFSVPNEAISHTIFHTTTTIKQIVSYITINMYITHSTSYYWCIFDVCNCYSITNWVFNQLHTCFCYHIIYADFSFQLVSNNPNSNITTKHL